MKGYPRRIATVQDFKNLLAMEEYKAQAIADLKALYAIDDAKITRATTLIDENDPEKGWNTEIIDNPLPRWKQIGFKSRKAVKDLIIKSEEK